MEIFPPDQPATPTAPSFQQFPRVSPLLTLLWMLLTFTLYLPYWLFTRTRILNRLYPQHPVPVLVPVLCAVSYAVLFYYSFQLPPDITLDQLMKDPQYLPFVSVAALGNLVQLVWIILFCQRLNACVGAMPGQPLYTRYSLLVLSNFLIVNVVYPQHKINQIITSQHRPDQPTGIFSA